MPHSLLLYDICKQNFLREEVKENLKWNVDRSSPSNKIRDLMGWTRDIMQDISYQRKILCNPIAMMFTKGWYVLLLILKLRSLFSWKLYVCSVNVFQAKKKRSIYLFIIILTLSFRLLWNHGATILSLAINLFMLVTWNAKASREDFDKHNQSITNQTLDRALLQE